jgi:hypothetical protein
MGIIVEEPSLRRIAGHVPWLRTTKGDAAIQSLTTGDSTTRKAVITEYRAQISAAKDMTDDQIINVYVRFLMSCPRQCPHCFPGASS